MTKGGKLLLGLLGLFLALSIALAQAAYRLERTALSYTYMSQRLDYAIGPLHDPVVHEETVRGILGSLGEALALEVPAKLEPHALKAAVTGFDADWFGRTGRRMLFNTEAVIKGRHPSLSLPVDLHDFKLALLDIARREFTLYHYVEIDHEVSRMPASYDLADLIPPGDLETIAGRLNRAYSLLFIPEYVVPGLLLLFCFVPLRMGSGLLAAGCGLFGGGGLVILATTVIRGRVIHHAGSVTDNLPAFLQWVEPGVEKLTGDIISGILPAAIMLTCIGAVLAACGVALVVRKGNPRIKVRRFD